MYNLKKNLKQKNKEETIAQQTSIFKDTFHREKKD